MEYLLHSLVLMIHYSTARNLLPAPVVSVDSLNFHHVLRWDPGPGTPSGTHFKVFVRNNKKQAVTRWNGTSCELRLEKEVRYRLSVQAVFNSTLQSNESQPISFLPAADTVIGAPHLSLSGCGNCIKLNISLPKADPYANIEQLEKYYDPLFEIVWKFAGGQKPVDNMKTVDAMVTLDYLEQGREYCVQVRTLIRINPNTRISKWECVATSVKEPSEVPAAVGIVAAVLVLCGGGGMALWLVLNYSCFLFGFTVHPPQTLQISAGNIDLLTPEGVTPDLVSVSPRHEKRPGRNGRRRDERSQRVPEGPQSEEEEDDDDDEDGGRKDYLSRAVELSSDSDSQGEVGGSPGGQMTSQGSRGQMEEVRGRGVDGTFKLDQEPRGMQRSSVYTGQGEGGEGAGVGGCVGEEEEEEEESSADVNLSSVLLRTQENSGNVNLSSAIFACVGEEEGEEEEEEEEELDSGAQPLIHHLDVERSDRGGYEARRERPAGGYRRHGDDEEEEQEQEVILSGYMERL